MTDDLITWLRAQLDEDERLAYNCMQAMSDSGEWDARDVGSSKQMPSVWRGRYLVARELSDEDAPHIARHDPARVLAEVDAKRRILAEHVGEHGTCSACSAEVNDGYDRVSVAWPCPTVRLMTLPHAEHPDYRDEWRPA